MSTDGREPSTLQRAPVPNDVLIRLRMDRGWTQTRLAKEFEVIAPALAERRPDLGLKLPGRQSVVKQIYRVERGLISAPDPMYQALWCVAFRADPVELFGDLDAPVMRDGTSTYAVTSHKFVPVYLGDQASRLADCLGAVEADGQWMPCRSVEVQHPGGPAALYLFPFGVGLFHVAEHLELDSVAKLATWRRSSYADTRAWVDDLLATWTHGRAAPAPYVLSAYWLHRPAWTGAALDTALRLLSMPSFLLDRDEQGANQSEQIAAAELVERALLRDGGCDRADLIEYGMRGVSIGYASWSGVAYYPLSPRRALTQDELVSCELAVQAMWCYSHTILQQVEAGQDPVVPDEYGWRFLRATLSRLTAPRPQETGQHCSMRDAILVSSGLPRQMTAAMDALRENGPYAR